MSADGKSNSDGNIALKGASSEAHSLQMSMENVRIREILSSIVSKIFQQCAARVAIFFWNKYLVSRMFHVVVK